MLAVELATGIPVRRHPFVGTATKFAPLLESLARLFQA